MRFRARWVDFSDVAEWLKSHEFRSGGPAIKRKNVAEETELAEKHCVLERKAAGLNPAA
jgi:hypothetical protein